MERRGAYKTFDFDLRNEVAVLKLKERRVYMNVSELFREEVKRVSAQNYPNWVVDLSSVSVMNSTGIGVLIALQNTVKKKNGRMMVVGLQPLMRDIFQRMRLEKLFEVEEDLDAALQKMQK